MKNWKSCLQILVVSVVTWMPIACSDDAADGPPGQDMTVVVPDASHDAFEEPDSTSDAADGRNMCGLLESCPCTRNTDCPRGSVCETSFGEDQCVTVTGCIVWNDSVAQDTGCYYDHDESLAEDSGYFGYPECTMDDECDDENPYCIRQICHRNPPCETDDDCEADDQRCYRGIICADEDRL